MLQMATDPLRIHPSEDDAERRALEELAEHSPECEADELAHVGEDLAQLSSDYEDLRTPPQPCDLAPGSPQKIAAMARRVAAGYNPTREGDEETAAFRAKREAKWRRLSGVEGKTRKQRASKQPEPCVEIPDATWQQCKHCLAWTEWPGGLCTACIRNPTVPAPKSRRKPDDREEGPASEQTLPGAA